MSREDQNDIVKSRQRPGHVRVRKTRLDVLKYNEKPKRAVRKRHGPICLFNFLMSFCLQCEEDMESDYNRGPRKDQARNRELKLMGCRGDEEVYRADIFGRKK